jgi:hypothetical protein
MKVTVFCDLIRLVMKTNTGSDSGAQNVNRLACPCCVELIVSIVKGAVMYH